jgi:hypothetical protein
MSTLPLAFSWQNVVDGNGIPLALTGLAIVFSGLLFIALFIASLPRTLRAWDRWREGRSAAKVAPGKTVEPDPTDPSSIPPEVQAALAWVAVRELEVFRLGDTQRLTLQTQHRSGLWRTLSTLRDNAPSD